jgi:hypothetical protein
MNMFTCSLCAALAVSTHTPSNLCTHCSRYVGTAGRLSIPWHRTAGKLDSITSQSVHCCTHRIQLHTNTPWVPFATRSASVLWCKLRSHLQFDDKHPVPHFDWQVRKSLNLRAEKLSSCGLGLTSTMFLPMCQLCAKLSTDCVIQILL